MNKKNFAIFISILITSIFFTMAFYISYANVQSIYQSVRAEHFYDGKILGEYENGEINSLEDIEGVKIAGGIAKQKDSAKLNNSMLVVRYQNSGINEMQNSSYIIDGEFPKNEKEIILSKRLMDKYNLSINDEIELSFGNRLFEGTVLDSMDTFTDREQFEENYKNTYKISGIYEDIFNKYTGLNLGITCPSEKEKLNAYIQFEDFEKAYKNKGEIEEKIKNRLGMQASMEISESMIEFYGVEKEGLELIMPKLVNAISLIASILLFVFFIKNIFWVWGVRKIRELSIYKSIGSTNFQIYLLLIKEALWLSILPIFLGHGIGYLLINSIYKRVQQIQALDKIKGIEFSPILSIGIISISILIIAFAIIDPAKKISKIDIIDGIKGNINLKNKKKKKNGNLWKELRINNLASIKSQRYISAIGIIIVSAFLLVIGISLYYRDYSKIDTDYNLNVYYTQKNQQKPKVLEEIMEEIPNKKAYISRFKYFSLENDWTLSDRAEEILSEDLKDYKDTMDEDRLDGGIIALEEKELEKLGGKKGEFLLLNIVQKDPKAPLSKAEYIEFFKQPEELTIYLSGGEPKNKIRISKSISSSGKIEERLVPFTVHIFTDLDTLNDLIANHETAMESRVRYELKMKVDDQELGSAKDYIEKKLKNQVSFDEEYTIFTGDEIANKQYTDVKAFFYLILGIGAIIFVLNITNAYSSINLSLMSRKREIGTLYSLGMDRRELKKQYSLEFIKEQARSFVLVLIAIILTMFIASILSKNLTMQILLEYYPWLYFIIFTIVIYFVNLLIYFSSLEKVLRTSIIELIKN